ncbi:hypothetical protein D3C79_1069640 [compost metagenome]
MAHVGQKLTFDLVGLDCLVMCLGKLCGALGYKLLQMIVKLQQLCIHFENFGGFLLDFRILV